MRKRSFLELCHYAKMHTNIVQADASDMKVCNYLALYNLAMYRSASAVDSKVGGVAAIPEVRK